MTPSQLAQLARKRMAKLSRTTAAKTARTPLGMALIGAVAVLIVVLVIAFSGSREIVEADKSGQSRRVGALYYPADKQWGSLTVVPVAPRIFRSEHLTEGKIAIDDDRSTLVFSPYSGRVMKLLAKPGDMVTAGQPLFIVEAPDMVQAQNDFINASAGLNKARSQLDYARIVEQQNKSLYETRAAPLRDVQQAAAGSLAAQNDLRSAETSLEVARNRLRILGKTDDEITKFGETGAINPQTTIYSPIDGTVVQRRVGPGQYVNTTSNSPAANDATFIIGDLTTVWLVAYVRESEAPNVKVGQALRFAVLAFPDRVFTANIAYVATALDAATRRLLVRATLNNKEGILRPEMFASVTILTGEGDSSLAVPREAIVYDGQGARVWKANDDRSIESRRITTGFSDGQFVQVLDGLNSGDKVIGKGSLFVDRDATGN